MRHPCRVLVAIGVAACGGDTNGSRGSPSTGTSETTTPVTGSVDVDDGAAPGSSGGAGLPACGDDYDGNQSHQTALDLGLDTTDTAYVFIGDGLVGSGVELGSDRLVVCGEAPSDFFRFEALCPSYLAVEVRKLDETVPEVFVSREDTGELVGEGVGDWNGFHLRPQQHRIDAGTHAIEVRHSSGSPQGYWLTAVVLPRGRCLG